MLSADALRELRTAVQEGGATWITGPRGSGLTTLSYDVRLVPGGLSLPVFHVELTNGGALRDIDERLAEVMNVGVDSLGLTSDGPERYAQVCRDRRAEGLVVLNNLHACGPQLRVAVCQLVLSVAAFRRIRFVVEGSFDPDTLLAGACPEGVPVAPVVLYADSVPPWRSLGMLEGMFSPGQEALAAAIADIVGTDLKMAKEIKDRLRGDPDQEEFVAAVRATQERGQRCAEVRAALQGVDAEHLERLLRFQVVPGVQPVNLDPGGVRDLLFAGIVVYDRLASGYVLRSPLVARLVAEHLGGFHEHAAALGSSCLHARTSLLVWHIGRVELLLRSAVRQLDYRALADEVSVEAFPRDSIARLKARLATVTAMGQVGPIIDEVLPSHRPLRDAVAERAGSGGELLESLTYSELVALCHRGAAVDDGDRSALERLRERRNDVAHFRPVDWSDLVGATNAARLLLRRVARRLWPGKKGDGTD